MKKLLLSALLAISLIASDGNKTKSDFDSLPTGRKVLLVAGAPLIVVGGVLYIAGTVVIYGPYYLAKKIFGSSDNEEQSNPAIRQDGV